MIFGGPALSFVFKSPSKAVAEENARKHTEINAKLAPLRQKLADLTKKLNELENAD